MNLFVVKADGKKVRIVTDFTRLNSFVERPVHPFACVSEILQTMPPTAKFFTKMDAVNGYFIRSLRLVASTAPEETLVFVRLCSVVSATSSGGNGVLLANHWLTVGMEGSLRGETTPCPNQSCVGTKSSRFGTERLRGPRRSRLPDNVGIPMVSK